MQIQSKTKKGWVLKIGDPMPGIASIEINGEGEHLGKPYLRIRYIPGGAEEKVFSGYDIEGWLVPEESATTTQLIILLKSLGLDVTASSLRAAITKGLTMKKKKNAKLSKVAKRNWKIKKVEKMVKQKKIV